MDILLASGLYAGSILGYETDPAGECGFGGFRSYTPLGFQTIEAYLADDNFQIPPGEPAAARATIDNPCGPPTRRGPCKDGGWRSYPDFKGQGQCVAFVNRGPKP